MPLIMLTKGFPDLSDNGYMTTNPDRQLDWLVVRSASTAAAPGGNAFLICTEFALVRGIGGDSW
jgi:hypothetical protein